MELKLTPSLVGPSDVRRIGRELAQLDDYFIAASARSEGKAAAAAPRISPLLDELARTNGLNLLEAANRKKLAAGLDTLIKQAPSLHISFATEATPRALERIVSWFRDNISPQTLLEVGLQPSIAAGCVLRTPNQFFDMSLSARLSKREPYLRQLISGAIK